MQANRQQLGALIERERAKFVAFVRRKAHDLSQMDAEDLVEEVLVHLWNRPDLSTPIEHLLAYLYQAMIHRLIDFRRKQRESVSLDDAEVNLADKLADASADLDTLLQRKELGARLYAALSELAPAQRAVWIATEVAGQTFAELSREWDEPVGTLLARKYRATKRLQMLLEDLREKEK